MKIGETMPLNREIVLNAGKPVREICVTNTGDRPIQVGSHYHFFEINRLLRFDRRAAYGFRLDIPSGTSVRFEPGEQRTVSLVAIGGKQRVFGLNDLTCARAEESTLEQSVQTARLKGMMEE